MVGHRECKWPALSRQVRSSPSLKPDPSTGEIAASGRPRSRFRASRAACIRAANSPGSYRLSLSFLIHHGNDRHAAREFDLEMSFADVFLFRSSVFSPVLQLLLH